MKADTRKRRNRTNGNWYGSRDVTVHSKSTVTSKRTRFNIASNLSGRVLR